MDDFVKDYYALPSAGERLRFLEHAEQELTRPENERLLCALLKKLLHARFGAHPARPHATDAFLAAFLSLRVTFQRDSGFLSRGKQKTEVLRAFAALLLPDFLIEPFSNSPAYPALLRAEWADFADTLFRTCLRDPAYRTRVFGLLPMSDEMTADRIRGEVRQLFCELPARFSLQRETAPLLSVMEERLAAVIGS